jgi:hypothetical protein
LQGGVAEWRITVAFLETRELHIATIRDRIHLHWMQHRYPQPLIHREKLARRILDRMNSSPSYAKRFAKPDELTIVTAHDYPEKSLFEQSLDYVLDGDYVVLQRPTQGFWRNWLKVRWLHEFLANGGCKTEFLLFCDASDVVLKGDPRVALDLLDQRRCDWLFMSTNSGVGSAQIPWLHRWADSIRPGRYLNAGVWVARTVFAKTVLAEMAQLAERLEQHHPHGHRGMWIDARDGLPACRFGCDQYLFRSLQPRYHPRMQVDYDNQLAYRN